MAVPGAAPLLRVSLLHRPMSPFSNLPTRAVLWTLFAAITVLWFGNLGSRDLMHPDEGRYAEIAR